MAGVELAVVTQENLTSQKPPTAHGFTSDDAGSTAGEDIGTPAVDVEKIQSVDGTIFASVCNLLKVMIGSGVLSMSWAMSLGSAIPTIAVIILVAVLSAFSLVLIAECCEKTKTFEYAKVWEVAFGSKLVILVNICLFATCFLNCLSYCIYIGDLMSDLFASYEGVVSEKWFHILVVGTVVLLPLCLQKNLKSLQYTSFFGISAIVFTIIVMAVKSTQKPRSPTFEHFFVSSQIFTTIGGLSQAFIAHYNAPALYFELKNRSIRRYWIVSGISFSVGAILFVTVALAGYSLFGEDCQGNILKNFGETSDVMVMLVRIAITLSVTFCYPLCFQPLYTAFSEIMKFCADVIGLSFVARSKDVDPTRKVIEVIFLLGLTMSLGMNVDNVGIVNAINGALAGSCIIYIFPALIALKLDSNSERTSTDGAGAHESCKKIRWKRIMSVILLGFGAVAGAVGIVTVLVKVVTD